MSILSIARKGIIGASLVALFVGSVAIAAFAPANAAPVSFIYNNTTHNMIIFAKAGETHADACDSVVLTNRSPKTVEIASMVDGTSPQYTPCD